MQFLRLLEIMLRDILTSTNIKLSDKNLIDETKGIIDPVEDFLEYYIQDASMENEFDENRLSYIKNALYAAKGAPQVFEVYENAFDTKITWDYPFPKLKVITFSKLKSSDIILFVNKFKELLYHLLYYTELTIEIRKLVLNILGELSQMSQVGAKGFYEVPTVIDEYGF